MMKPGLIVLDTNVWMDFYLNRENKSRVVINLMDAIEEHGSMIATTDGICKDTFYLLWSELKSPDERDSVEVSPESVSASAKESAWGCIRDITRHSINIPGTSSDPMRAITLRDIHDDFEDDLLIAVCEYNDVRMIVSSDKKLQSHSPIKCMSIEGATKYLTCQ